MRAYMAMANRWRSECGEAARVMPAFPSQCVNRRWAWRPLRRWPSREVKSGPGPLPADVPPVLAYGVLRAAIGLKLDEESLEGVFDISKQFETERFQKGERRDACWGEGERRDACWDER